MTERDKDKKPAQDSRDQRGKEENKTAGDGSSGSAGKQATNDRQGHEIEAAANTDPADGNGSRPDKARSPSVRRRTASTGTITANQGDATHKK